MWAHYFGNPRTRVHALVLCIGVVLGGSVPELGNLVAYWTQAFVPHYFNRFFLVAGLVGVVVCGVALCRR